MENEIKPRFIKVLWNLQVICVNPINIKTAFYNKQKNEFKAFSVEFDYFGKTALGKITKEDYEWLVGQKVEQIDEWRKEFRSENNKN